MVIFEDGLFLDLPYGREYISDDFRTSHQPDVFIFKITMWE
jgi:hypothetical protein